MDSFLLTAAAAYLGSLAALVTFRAIFGRGAQADAPSSPPLPRTSKWHALGGAGAFSLIAAVLLYLVTNGDMAPALALIALVLSLLVIVFSLRAMRA